MSPETDLPTETPSGRSAEVERLERRLHREREARRAAEAIAEKGLRDLYDQQRRQRLLETIATAANATQSVRDVLAFALAQVCDFTGWPLGHAYRRRELGEVGRLVSTGLWSGGDEPRFDGFRSQTEATALRAGRGLPGRVLESGAPAWLRDVAVDPNFPRATVALECGLRSAFAFPVLVGTKVVGVLEFFSEQAREPDEELLRDMAQIGAQLGRAVERDRAERELRAGNARLQRMVREAETQRRAAEAASRAKSVFLAAASHEVRTPLNAVLGLAEALRREPLTVRQSELAEGVLDAGGLLLRLLNNVLAAAEAGDDVLEDGGEGLWGSTRTGEPAPALAPAARRLQVLAAEDNPANRRVLQLLLEPAELDLTMVEDGKAALEAAAEGGFDLVLMDANMPVMDGVASLTAIRALDGPAARTPVYMVTANVFPDDLRRYRKAGCDGVLAKPILVPELYAVLARAAEAGGANLGAAAGVAQAG